MRLVKCLISALLLLLPVESFALTPAFPTAVGLGKWSQGGRGGQVIKVTNLNDSGPGSLRAALATSGPRIIVFTVSGNIDLTSLLYVTEPYVTIAGQTSPGGISVSGKQFNISTHDVIVRHMRFRAGGHRYTGDDSDGDSFSLWGPGWYAGVVTNNIIVDHCSVTWGVDETFSVTGGATNVTLQHNLIAQGLQYAKAGPTDQHSKGLMISGKVNPGWAGQDSSVSIYRNYMAHNEDRSPMMFNRETDNSNMVLDGVNNVIYNPKIRSITAGDAHVNWIGNFLKDGPWTTVVNSIMEVQFPASEPLLYTSGNLAMRKTGAVFKESSAADWPFITTNYPFNPVPASPYQQPTRWEVAEPLTALPMTTDLAAEIVAKAGAMVPLRDSVDTAIVNSYTSGADLRLNNVVYPNDWPTYSTASDNPTDTDNDGMPDTWETAKGLNPSVANATAHTLDADYTDVEVWINELAGDSGTILPTDTTAPVVTGFTLPATYSSSTVPVATFTATDDVGITEYAITTSSTQPTAEWSSTKPTTISANVGANTFYAWAKDAAGNVSNSVTATVTVTLPAAGKGTISGKFKAKAR